jgi:hypothetical protein
MNLRQLSGTLILARGAGPRHHCLPVTSPGAGVLHSTRTRTTMRDEQPRTSTATIFALTDDARNNIKVQIEPTGLEIVIAERNQLAGLTLPRDHVIDLHRALGRYLESKS